MEAHARIEVEPAFLTHAEVAVLLGVPERTIEGWRLTRLGPAWLKLGRHVKYDRDDVLIWARAVAQHEASHVPAVVEARAEATQARQIVSEITARQSRERMALYERVLGIRRPSAIAARVKALREQAAQDRRYLAQLDVLLSDEAVKLVHERAARAELQRLSAEEARRAAEARATRLDAPAFERNRGRSPHSDGPSL